VNASLGQRVLDFFDLEVADNRFDFLHKGAPRTGAAG
jgi:hypothetical protein